MVAAVVYCYLAWIAYCFRRELEQGQQLDDDPAMSMGRGGHGLGQDRAEKPMGRAVDEDIEVTGGSKHEHVPEGLYR